jgi:ABC-2 type transport system ATP-binding protein
MLHVVLQLCGIAKAFGTRRALVDVSLEVSAGEVVLLVGPNGAGKTTLLRVATGFIDPDQGTAAIDGISLATHRSDAQARIGYLPENAPAPAELTVRDHLLLRARLKRSASPRLRERVRTRAVVDEAMSTVGLAGQAGRLIGTLSKGFRQRVGLADALLWSPPLLVLDEPTTGMDPMQVRELRDRLAVAAQQRAVLVSSHAVADLASVASRVAVVHRGGVIAVATPEALRIQTESATLEDAVVALCTKGAKGLQQNMLSSEAQQPGADRERARSDRPSPPSGTSKGRRTRRYGDRGREDESREVPGMRQ